MCAGCAIGVAGARNGYCFRGLVLACPFKVAWLQRRAEQERDARAAKQSKQSIDTQIDCQVAVLLPNKEHPTSGAADKYAFRNHHTPHSYVVINRAKCKKVPRKFQERGNARLDARANDKYLICNTFGSPTLGSAQEKKTVVLKGSPRFCLWKSWDVVNSWCE
jgi:hypothetical protein